MTVNARALFGVSIDTTELRKEVLVLLCENRSIREVLRELPGRMAAVAELDQAGHLELASIVRQMAEGRRRLLVPGRYRGAAAKSAHHGTAQSTRRAAKSPQAPKRVTSSHPITKGAPRKRPVTDH